MAPYIDRAHAPTHVLDPRGADPLDSFLDTVSAQTATGVKTLVNLPLLGTCPVLGSQMVALRCLAAGAAGSSFIANIFSVVSGAVSGAGGSVGLLVARPLTVVDGVRPGGSVGLIVSRPFTVVDAVRPAGSSGQTSRVRSQFTLA